jgi:hypothetical protein
MQLPWKRMVWASDPATDAAAVGITFSPWRDLIALVSLVALMAGFAACFPLGFGPVLEALAEALLPLGPLGLAAAAEGVEAAAEAEGMEGTEAAEGATTEA